MKVAKIVDVHTLVVTKEAGRSIEVGQILAVCNDPITDPETGEHLGFREQVRLKVVSVHPRFCVAETYRIVPRRPIAELLALPPAAWPTSPITVTVNIGDEVELVSEGSDARV